ncbi:MAG: threonine/serine dehydratase [Planctomycetes bacterium]|nr:threonine/serine dehydratase [Planctomycetota bacterium]
MSGAALDLTLADIEAARARLGDRIHETPLVTAHSLSRAGCELRLKCENLQKVGAFKARGALNHLLQLSLGRRARGVSTYSSGNHGAALAWAARELGVAATIFVPEDIPVGKRAAIEGYGGRVIVAGRTSRDRKQACEADAARRDCAIVPPFDDPWIVAGQGTCGLELLEQAPDVRRVLVPVGGGGLLAGIALAVRSRRADVEVIGVEPDAAASMSAALRAGAPVEIDVGSTIADGLKPVQVGVLNYAVASRLVARVITVSDAQIRAAMRLLIERCKLVVEPSGAATVAAWLALDDAAAGGVTVAVLSGGNVDCDRLVALLA